SSDNCGITDYEIAKGNVPATDTGFEIGRASGSEETGGNTVTLRVTDAHGNSATCTATVTVTDTGAPTPVCQPVNKMLSGTSVSVSAGEVNDGSSDNCGITYYKIAKGNVPATDTGF